MDNSLIAQILFANEKAFSDITTQNYKTIFNTCKAAREMSILSI